MAQLQRDSVNLLNDASHFGDESQARKSEAAVMQAERWSPFTVRKTKHRDNDIIRKLSHDCFS